jgi:acyl dehydratase
MGMTDLTENKTVASRIEEIRRRYGDAPRVHDWFTVTQDVIDRFCYATFDTDWLHHDPVRARRDGPYGGIIAPGFWTVSMLSHLSRRSTGEDFPAGARLGINYGFDRLRFPGPVRVGSRIRLKSKLVEITPRDNGQFLVKTENTVEVEGQDKPALIADWLILLLFVE